MPPVHVLILGLGWTGDYLASLLTAENISYASTTTTGRDNTISFNYDPTLDDPTPFQTLPVAQYIVITFPIRGTDAATRFLSFYTQTHQDTHSSYILLGSTRPWTPSPDTTSVWMDRHTPPNPTLDTPRQSAESVFLSSNHCVLNLAGLWGGQRNPRNWVSRIGPTKDLLETKGSVHLVHGHDVAAAILAVIKDFTGERWLVTDMRVYDWWDLAAAWGRDGQDRWVVELMERHGVRALPRPVELLGRAIDTRDFWIRFGISPKYPRVDVDK
ncbi:hypothetical protein BC832DRAFT_528354 [Gaertneriomyces semiglobifer]|nr:hypothetical protein BC832DRAFT_528354 [Gaertneriomyces semiglobifer]